MAAMTSCQKNVTEPSEEQKETFKKNYTAFLDHHVKGFETEDSSLIAEYKFSKRNPLLATNERVVLKTSPFSQNIMLNRYLMKFVNFNTLNTIPEYANTKFVPFGTDNSN